MSMKLSILAAFLKWRGRFKSGKNDPFVFYRQLLVANLILMLEGQGEQSNFRLPSPDYDTQNLARKWFSRYNND